MMLKVVENDRLEYDEAMSFVFRLNKRLDDAEEKYKNNGEFDECIFAYDNGIPLYANIFGD